MENYLRSSTMISSDETTTRVGRKSIEEDISSREKTTSRGQRSRIVRKNFDQTPIDINKLTPKNIMERHQNYKESKILILKNKKSLQILTSNTPRNSESQQNMNSHQSRSHVDNIQHHLPTTSLLVGLEKKPKKA